MEQKNMTQEVAMMRNEDDLFMRVTSLIEKSRKQVVKAINTAMVYTYYSIGHYIVEFEQGGNARAEYGKGVLKRLSARLTEKFGDGWSYANLRSMRQFYMVYSKMLTSGQQNQNDDQRSANLSFILPWTHYQIIMRLCPSKNDALVELTLPKDANIYAQQYALCLPDKKLLQQKLSEWVQEYEMLNRKEGEV